MSDSPDSSRPVFLLRCWRERSATPADEAVWRFSIEKLLSDQPPQGCADLDAVLNCLRAQLRDAESGST